MTSKGSDHLILEQHDRITELVRQVTSKLVIISVVSSIQTGGYFIFGSRFLKPLDVTKMPEMSDLLTTLKTCQRNIKPGFET